MHKFVISCMHYINNTISIPSQVDFMRYDFHIKYTMLGCILRVEVGQKTGNA